MDDPHTEELERQRFEQIVNRLTDRLFPKVLVLALMHVPDGGDDLEAELAWKRKVDPENLARTIALLGDQRLPQWLLHEASEHQAWLLHKSLRILWNAIWERDVPEFVPYLTLAAILRKSHSTTQICCIALRTNKWPESQLGLGDRRP